MTYLCWINDGFILMCGWKKLNDRLCHFEGDGFGVFKGVIIWYLTRQFPIEAWQ